MAWRCSASTNAGLISNLFESDIIKSTRVRDAMLLVDRAAYFGADVDRMVAYEDSPHPIGHGQTISAPHMHAFALQLLEPYLLPGVSALDLGSGSGYLAAAMAELVGHTGAVYGVELVKPLFEASLRNLAADGKESYLRASAESTPRPRARITLRHGDGSIGWPDSSAGPFSAIHVGAAAPRVRTCMQYAAYDVQQRIAW